MRARCFKITGAECPIALLIIMLPPPCWARAQNLPLRVPPPLSPRTQPSQGVGPTYAYAATAAGRGEIVVIAQTVQVTTRPDNSPTQKRSSLTVRLKSYWDIPMVSRARFAVVEQLTGHTYEVPHTMTVTNPDISPSLMMAHGDHVMTRRVRVGDLWLLAWDPNTKRVDIEGGPGAGLLSGLDDPELAMFRLDQRWLHKLDRNAALAEMATAVDDPKQPIGVRKFALGGVFGAAFDQGLRAPRGPIAPRFWRIEAELLHGTDTPPDLRLAALGYLCVDASRPIDARSDEAFLLRHLIHLIDASSEPQTVQIATQRAYEANMQVGPFANGKQTVYLFPDIIAALERRAQRELAQNPGRGGPASGTLNNLSLVGRRSEDQAAKGGAHVVLRTVPPA